jgi:response regulator RpfG family c-di-GMP phosphodiesterase
VKVIYQNHYISKPKLRIIIVDENRDITYILAGTLGLKGFEVFKAYITEECLNKVNELGDKVDIVFVDGKIATDRGAMLIIKVKREKILDLNCLPLSCFYLILVHSIYQFIIND